MKTLDQFRWRALKALDEAGYRGEIAQRLASDDVLLVSVCKQRWSIPDHIARVDPLRVDWPRLMYYVDPTRRHAVAFGLARKAVQASVEAREGAAARGASEAARRASSAIREALAAAPGRPSSETYDEYMRSDAWREKRRRFFASKMVKVYGVGGKWACFCCGATDVPFDLHHRSYRRFGRERINLDLVPVCRPCHDAVHVQTRDGLSVGRATSAVRTQGRKARGRIARGR